MYYFAKKEGIQLREMQDDRHDYTIMAKWLSDPIILEYYEGRDNPFDLERIIEKYAPRVQKKSKVIPCIIEYNQQAIGYIQYYPIVDDYETDGAVDFSAYSAPYGIDLFIGEVSFWNQGLGTLVIQAILMYLFERNISDGVFIDPKTSNTRAIKCYEKCGFTPITVIKCREEHEGAFRDSLIMSISKNKPF